MKNVVLLFMISLLASCSSSNDVVHNGFLQKRKYKKGYNLSFKKKENKGTKVDVIEPTFAIENKINKIVNDVEVLNTLSKDESKQELVLATISENNYIEIHSVIDKLLINDKAEKLLKNVVEEEEDKDVVSSSANRSLGVVSIVLGAIITAYSYFAILATFSALFYFGLLVIASGIMLLVISNGYEKVIEDKEEDYVEEQEYKKKKRNRDLSNLFTWLTALFPLFFIPALVFNIIVISQSKGEKKKRNSAIWRIIASIFLMFISVSLLALL